MPTGNRVQRYSRIGKIFLPTRFRMRGTASAANVATFTRFAMRTGLPGRPRPHSRRKPPNRSRGSLNASYYACPLF